MILILFYLYWIHTLDFLNASWPSLHSVHALTTTRLGGASRSPFDENNLGLHVGDNPNHVLNNRTGLIQKLNLKSSPAWLEQTHSNTCVVIEEDENRNADASVTRRANTVLAIMTADCLPILLMNKQGNEIAAIHAGWRGLANGIIDSTLKKMHSNTTDIIAWIGPAICERCFKTGEEVRTAFVNHYPFTHNAFLQLSNGLHGDLPKIAELILQERGITSVYQSKECTVEALDENNRRNKYFSYRREKQTGRIATLIWFE